MPQMLFRSYTYTELFQTMQYVRRSYKNAEIQSITSHTEGRAFKETFLIVVVNYEEGTVEEPDTDE